MVLDLGVFLASPSSQSLTLLIDDDGDDKGVAD